MKTIVLLIVAACAVFFPACAKNDTKPANTAAANVVKQPTQPPPIKDGNYNGKGTVTKVDLSIGAVELNHENIEGLMPAMQMEFYVTDKALLKGLAAGDKADFVIEYKQGRETINSIKKTK
ncbi:MAG TPA: copper-binding protein [Pyrinomonadaceae bacterium]|jgi:Cu/Ag efflux protein CusF|nr:copper-binding protein [Pyrinomonadaceae bacterium]